jgi:hypothetical protein
MSVATCDKLPIIEAADAELVYNVATVLLLVVNRCRVGVPAVSTMYTPDMSDAAAMEVSVAVVDVGVRRVVTVDRLLLGGVIKVVNGIG